MSWYTDEITPGMIAIMDDGEKVGTIIQGEKSWLVDVYAVHALATLKDYTSCLAFIQGVEQMMIKPRPVTVTASDYSYDGWVVARFQKRKSGQIRYVVEDENGRLFIHNGKQIGTEGWHT